MLFRVWDKKNNCYSKEPIRINDNGNVFYQDLRSFSYSAPWYLSDDYEIEFNTGITLADGTETFFGDIVKLTDSNWGYGGEYDKTHDSYWYTVITKNNFCDMIIYWSGEGNVWCSDMELVGNIHETELTDAMKVWMQQNGN